jgi:small GTP-binding protein
MLSQVNNMKRPESGRRRALSPGDQSQAGQFTFDVFLSHSSNDKPEVRKIAQRLRDDGLRVWFDEWEIKPGDSIPAKIEQGLEQSGALLLCMSANAFGSDWAQLESGTFRFRDPLNKARRFIPLRLDGARIPGSLGQFMYVDWRVGEREEIYATLLDACRRPFTEGSEPAPNASQVTPKKSIAKGDILACAFNSAASKVMMGGAGGLLRIYSVGGKQKSEVLVGHVENVWSVAWSADARRAASCSEDGVILIWDIATKKCLRIVSGHKPGIHGGKPISTLKWTTDQSQIVSVGQDGMLRIWDAASGVCQSAHEMSKEALWGVAVGKDVDKIAFGSSDGKVHLWDMQLGKFIRVLEGHTGQLRTVAWSPDQRQILSGGEDATLRLWDAVAGTCLRILEGHTGYIWDIAWRDDCRYAVSGSMDGTTRLWDIHAGRCLAVIEAGTGQAVRGVAWASDQCRIVSAGGNKNAFILTRNVAKVLTSRRNNNEMAETEAPSVAQIDYTNAKVLIVGESGAGKTGLSKVLAGEKWQASDSTVGAWATQCKLPMKSVGSDVEREVWLWDFGGQADQRLIHQLYFDQTAAAVLVFDGQKEDVFETIGQWDRDLARASGGYFAKILAAGRVDAGSLRLSRNQLEAFAKERGYCEFLETSAKTGRGCDELKQAILDNIKWDEIPWRTSPLLFKRLKDEIVRLKDEGRVLMRFNELRENLRLLLPRDFAQFSDAELTAVTRLLAGPGVIWMLKFGNWVLLQPERINAYAQAVIQTMREDESERGCIAEDRVLNGELTYNSSISRLDRDDERFVILAMHQVLVERSLCLRQHTDRGPVLIFPSYYRRERPELVGHPAVLVSYRFSGFLDDVYATLVVQLHHTSAFTQDQLWRYAADFRTLTGNKQLGVKLNRRGEGAAELEVYFDPTIAMEEKIIFSRYVHEHLQQNAQDVVRLRHYVCPHCGTPVGNREVAMERLAEGKTDIGCVKCDDSNRRVPLWDEMEELFSDPGIKRHVAELRGASTQALDSESKERALVGEVISTVALAGQISRELTVSDQGIDMEVEFKSDIGQATGDKVYLQLKAGSSHLVKRKSDGAEVFKIKKLRHADYWREQAFPVLLLIQGPDGLIRFMDVREYLRHESNNGQKRVSQIIFSGERFDVMSVRRWRDHIMK